MSSVLYNIILGAVLGGAGCALVGFLLVNLRLPFLAVCLSHAAMAGAVMGHFLGLPPLASAFAAALLAALVLGPLTDATKADLNTVMAILFTLALGLTFLGIGLTPGNKSEVLSLLWGSILLLRPVDLVWTGLALLAAVGVVWAFFKEFKAILFDRHLAAASGIRARFFFYLLLILAGGVITVNLYTIGGLMLFSLLVSPAASALQFGLRFRSALYLSVLLGVLSAGGGLFLSFLLHWPAGASIVVFSGLVFAVSVAGRIAHRREV
jgi:manganese/iron transport system permease protein